MTSNASSVHDGRKSGPPTNAGVKKATIAKHLPLRHITMLLASAAIFSAPTSVAFPTLAKLRHCTGDAVNGPFRSMMTQRTMVTPTVFKQHRRYRPGIITRHSGIEHRSRLEATNESSPRNIEFNGLSSSPEETLANKQQLTRRRRNSTPPAAEADSIDKFAQDITTVLKSLRSEGSDPSLPHLFRNINMPSFTNIWTRNDWKMHTSRWRYLKYFLSLPTSRLLRRIMPQLTILFVWACAACWICGIETHRRVVGGIQRAVLPLAPLSLVSTFVALLLTLRSNQGLSRLNEGRLAFGKVVLYTREMSQLIATVVFPRHPQLGLLAARHTSIFGWLLKDFLRHYDEDYARPLQTYQPIACFEEDIVTTMLPAHGTGSQNQLSVDANFILSQRKKPVATCTRLRQIFAYMQDEVGMTTSEQSRLDSCAQQLNKCVTICERIRTSPIPPLYTAHAGRLLVFYLIFLPLALRGSALLNNLGTILTTTVVGFAMLGLDEISFLLEEPFRLMPLYHMSKNSMKDCADAFVNMPPPLPVETWKSLQEEMEYNDDDGNFFDEVDIGNDGDSDNVITRVAAGVGVGETSPPGSVSTLSPPSGTANSGKHQVIPDYW